MDVGDAIDTRKGDIVGRVTALFCTDAVAAGLRLMLDPRFRRPARCDSSEPLFA